MKLSYQDWLLEGRKMGKYSKVWKGGRYTSKAGYVIVWAKNHPNAQKYGRAMEHIVVMADYLGRRIKTEDGESVHHKNGIRHDNRIENLELRIKHQHPQGQSLFDVYKFCQDFIKKHKDDVKALRLAKKHVTNQTPILKEPAA